MEAHTPLRSRTTIVAAPKLHAQLLGLVRDVAEGSRYDPTTWSATATACADVASLQSTGILPLRRKHRPPIDAGLHGRAGNYRGSWRTTCPPARRPRPSCCRFGTTHRAADGAVGRLPHPDGPGTSQRPGWRRHPRRGPAESIGMASNSAAGVGGVDGIRPVIRQATQSARSGDRLCAPHHIEASAADTGMPWRPTQEFTHINIAVGGVPAARRGELR